MRRAAERFGIPLDPGKLTGQKEDAYFEAAKAVFEEEPEVAVFVYGHTHEPSIHVGDGRAMVNTGTWIKQFERVYPRFGLLPKVYVPKYRLNDFRIHEEGDAVIITYTKFDKTTAPELTLTQRLIASSTGYAAAADSGTGPSCGRPRNPRPGNTSAYGLCL